jgi:hypothetical protein
LIYGRCVSQAFDQRDLNAPDPLLLATKGKNNASKTQLAEKRIGGEMSFSRLAAGSAVYGRCCALMAKAQAGRQGLILSFSICARERRREEIATIYFFQTLFPTVIVDA